MKNDKQVRPNVLVGRLFGREKDESSQIEGMSMSVFAMSLLPKSAVVKSWRGNDLGKTPLFPGGAGDCPVSSRSMASTRGGFA